MLCIHTYACTVCVRLYYNKEKQPGNIACEIMKPVFRKMWKTFTRRSQDKLFLRSELYPIVQSGIIVPKPIKCNIAFVLVEYDYMVRAFWPDRIIITKKPSGNERNFTTDLCKDLLPGLILSVTSRINNACKQWTQNEVVWFWQQNILHLAKAYVSNSNDFTSN